MSDPIISDAAGVTVADAGQWPNIPAAAKIAGISPHSLRRRIASGTLPAYDVLGVTRINPQDLADGVTRIVPRRSRETQPLTSRRKRRLQNPELARRPTERTGAAVRGL